MSKVTKIAISLYPEDLKIIDEADGIDAGRSATLRQIIREWKDTRGRVDALAQHVTQLLVERAKEGEYVIDSQAEEPA